MQQLPQPLLHKEKQVEIWKYTMHLARLFLNKPTQIRTMEANSKDQRKKPRTANKGQKPQMQVTEYWSCTWTILLMFTITETMDHVRESGNATNYFSKKQMSCVHRNKSNAHWYT